jgi:hypothetical protein
MKCEDLPMTSLQNANYLAAEQPEPGLTSWVDLHKQFEILTAPEEAGDVCTAWISGRFSKREWRRL